MAQERATEQGLTAEAIVRHEQLRTALIEVAKETGATLIVLGRPLGMTAVFEEESLQVFAALIHAETGIAVRIMP